LETDFNSAAAPGKWFLSRWLLEHIDEVVAAEKGLLLTCNGVLPVIQCEQYVPPFSLRDEWLATTWISFDGLEDHTPQKKRVADAARKARREGLTFTTY